MRPSRRSRRLGFGLGLGFALAACATANPSPGDDGDDSAGFDREVRGGQVHQTVVSVDVAELSAGIVDRSSMELILRDRELTEVLPPMTPDDFTDLRSVTSASAGEPLIHVSGRQQLDGIPIHGTYLGVTIAPGQRGKHLAASAYHVYGSPRIDTTPQLGRDAAVTAARAALRASTAAERDSRLEIWPIDGGLRLVWVVDLAGVDRRALVHANGPRAGAVTEYDDRVFDADGTVRGHVAIGGAPGSLGIDQLLPLRDLTVSAGGVTTTTAADGSFAFAAPDGSTVTATAIGTATTVIDAGGANVTASQPAGSGLALDLGAADEATLAQGTTYHFVTGTRAFLVSNGFPEADFGAPLPANVNLTQTCNAYFSPFDRTINFFHSGGGCQNSAEASIIAHEYGHFVDNNYGGITEGGLSEGWGDTLACYMLNNPIVGGDLLPGEIIRTCDNTYQYPAGGGDEVHALGQAWAGFAWHARQGLIAQLGFADGDALARALVLPSLPSNASDIPAAVREVFLRDDDDGDLSNHTPHWDVLLAAADQHSLGFVVNTDLVKPSAITDLATVSSGITSAVLSWTAPGDDGTEGTAASYDLRTSPAPITEANFASATPVPAPDPLAAGGAQEATIPMAPGATVYVAVRAVDEAGNQGDLSNVLAVTPAPSTTVYSDGAEGGLGTWTATGLWHVTMTRAASGTSSFWYGNEATGNYDTPGAANSGALTSPVIDLTGVDQPALVISQFLSVEDGLTFDLATITITDVDDPTVVVTGIKTTGFTGGVFVPRVLDLAPLTGRRVQIAFAFNTVDSILNQTPGWFVDDVLVIGAAAPEPEPRLLINEVLADPPPGYDAGGDGIASTTADEMIELVNIGNGPLDLSGWTLADAIRTRVTFAAGTTIPAGGVLVVLGGGSSQLGVPTVIANGLFLNNLGDTVRVRKADGELVDELSYGTEANHNSSLTHQLDGDPLSPIVRHLIQWGTPASPGKRGDGTAWGGGTPTAVLVINEILADPAAGYDPSGDGVANTVSDEFIEVVNIGDAPSDLGGATISDAIGVRVTLPAGTVIQPGDALVVFGGGGVGLSIPGVTFVSLGTLALNNPGDTITIRQGATTLVSASYGTAGGNDQSLVRGTEEDPGSAFVPHLSVSANRASPGLRANGSAL